jgi:3-hydroxyacyl-CoA dehydrogenase
MGPLETADLVGLDTVHNTLEVLVRETGDPKFTPAKLLVIKVAAGELGRKSGRGFYDYDNA